MQTVLFGKWPYRAGTPESPISLCLNCTSNSSPTQIWLFLEKVKNSTSHTVPVNCISVVNLRCFEQIDRYYTKCLRLCNIASEVQITFGLGKNTFYNGSCCIDPLICITNKLISCTETVKILWSTYTIYLLKLFFQATFLFRNFDLFLN